MVRKSEVQQPRRRPETPPWVQGLEVQSFEKGPEAPPLVQESVWNSLTDVYLTRRLETLQVGGQCCSEPEYLKEAA